MKNDAQNQDVSICREDRRSTSNYCQGKFHLFFAIEHAQKQSESNSALHKGFLIGSGVTLLEGARGQGMAGCPTD